MRRTLWLVMALCLSLALGRPARAETGLLDRRLATPAVAKFTAGTSDDGRIVVRTFPPEGRDEAGVTFAAREALPALPSPRSLLLRGVELRPIAPRATDAFDALLVVRATPGFAFFLDAPESLTGDESKELGRRVEPNRVDGYGLHDDWVAVGVHASWGPLFVELFYRANTYGVLGLDAGKREREALVLARRDPHRVAARASLALADDRSLELTGEVAIEQPLGGGPTKVGARGGLRGTF